MAKDEQKKTKIAKQDKKNPQAISFSHFFAFF